MQQTRKQDVIEPHYVIYNRLFFFFNLFTCSGATVLVTCRKCPSHIQHLQVWQSLQNTINIFVYFSEIEFEVL
jgi:ABC-type uncharacterized transport system involved in gliding motility auxiliary subunit